MVGARQGGRYSFWREGLWWDAGLRRCGDGVDGGIGGVEVWWMLQERYLTKISYLERIFRHDHDSETEIGICRSVDAIYFLRWTQLRKHTQMYHITVEPHAYYEKSPSSTYTLPGSVIPATPPKTDAAFVQRHPHQAPHQNYANTKPTPSNFIDTPASYRKPSSRSPSRPSP